MLRNPKYHLWMHLEGPNKTSYTLRENDHSTRSLSSSGKLRSVVWWLVTDVSKHHDDPISKGHILSQKFVTNYQSTSHSILEDSIPQTHGGRRLTSAQ